MASSNFVVIYDACVLYPASLRDLLMRLACTRLFKAKWTDDINKEWVESLLQDYPDTKRENIERTKELMTKAVPDCLISRDLYEDFIPVFKELLPDKDDAHVVAAAHASRAEIIVTANLSDFPKKVLEKYNIEAVHPDTFVDQLLDLNEVAVKRCFNDQVKSLRNPPLAKKDVIERLRLCGLNKSLQRLKN